MCGAATARLKPGGGLCSAGMAATCFCGCGLEVPFGRRRLANASGARLDEYLAIFRGALERDPDPAQRAELGELAATGGPLRDGLRDVVHGTLDRKAYDKDAARDWMQRAIDVRGAMAKQLIADDYAGWNAMEQTELVNAGVRAQAVVIGVEDTGTTVNNSPRVRIRLRVEPEGEEPFEVERKLLVSRVAFPRRGERVEVFYDPDDHERFTFRNDDLADDPVGGAAAEPSRLDELAKLGELRATGVLTEAEFEAEKRRILDGG